MLSTRDRFTHPTTADIQAVLDIGHCDLCEGMGTGLQAWWSDPNTVQGREQLDTIGGHLLDTMAFRVQCMICGGLITELGPFPISHDLAGDYDHRPVVAVSSDTRGGSY